MSPAQFLHRLNTLPPALLFSAVSAGYALLGLIGLSFAITPGYASPVFPAAGFALAAVLLFGLRQLPAVWLGSLLVNLVQSALHGQFSVMSAGVAILIATGAAAQAWLGSSLVRRFCGDSWQNITREHSALSLLMLGGPLACLCSASVGTAGLYLFSVIPLGLTPYTWWNWYIGDTLGVLVFTPLTLCALHETDGLARRQRWFIIIPMSLILILEALAFSGVAHWEKQTMQLRLKADGEGISKRIADRLITHREVLTSLHNFIGTIPDCSFSQFEQFTRISLRNNSDIFALSINDLVPDSERARYERRMGGLSPLGPYRITERDSLRRLVPAGKRPHYVAVRYIVPLEGNKPAVGFDINSEPLRRDAVDRALAADDMAVTPPIRLVQEQKSRIGVLELMPVRPSAGGPVQFAVSVVKVDEMVDIATRGHIPDGLQFQITDTKAPAGKDLLHRSTPPSGEEVSWHRPGQWQTMLRMGDRDWLFSVYTTGRYHELHRPWIAWVSGIVGLVFASLFQLLMLGMAGRNAELDRITEARKAREQAEAHNRVLMDRVAAEVKKNREKDTLMLHQDKLASIGQLAAGVAHEINNPISFIMSNLRTLSGYAAAQEQYIRELEETGEAALRDEERRKLEKLRGELEIPYVIEDSTALIAESLEGAERVRKIVHDLKDFARPDQRNLEPADLNDCVRSTVNMVRNEIKYVAELDLDLGDIPRTVCNPQQINQVIANLLVNAAQAVKEGDGRITVRTVCESGSIRLTVSDNGHGIPAAIRGRIFDPFFTTKDVGKGTGLGLSISYDIIKKHRGAIFFETGDTGTTFTVMIPVTDRAESE